MIGRSLILSATSLAVFSGLSLITFGTIAIASGWSIGNILGMEISLVLVLVAGAIKLRKFVY
jgi:hypothetical protein